MRRLRFPPDPVPIPVSWALCQARVYIGSGPRHMLTDYESKISPMPSGSKPYSVLLIFGNTEKLLDEKLQSGLMMSKIVHGRRPVCLLERTNYWINFDVFPPGVFVSAMNLIRVDRTLLPTGFLIRLGPRSSSRHVLFVGIDSRSERLHRFCSVVPGNTLKETPNRSELLTRLLSLMKEKSESSDASWEQGIAIIMREEAITGVCLICLTCITCQETDVVKLESDNDEVDCDSDTRSDVAVKAGPSARHHR